MAKKSIAREMVPINKRPFSPFTSKHKLPRHTLTASDSELYFLMIMR